MGWLSRTVTLAGAVTAAYLGASAAMVLSMSNRERRLGLNDDPSAVGMEFREVSFTSRRSAWDAPRQLSGWLIPPQSEGEVMSPRETRWVVLVHGDGANRSDPQVGLIGLAASMRQLGYGLLMFDLRGCGNSEDGEFTGGWRERLDVLGALDYLVKIGADRARIGVIGFSLGAVAATLACSSPGVVAAVVADSAYSDLWEMLKRRFRLKSGFSTIIRPGFDLMTQMLIGHRLAAVSPELALSESDTPVLIIHGARDEEVPMESARRLARARGVSESEIDAGDSERIWIHPDAEHVKTYRTVPGEYVARVSEFLSKHLAS